MKIRILLLNIILCCLTANTLSQTATEKDFTVVIDPGHGGKDPGAVRKGVRETDINLKIALLVGKMLKENHSDINVVFTREKETTLTPKERMDIANKANGDIFVSIHVNSAYNSRKKRDVTSVHGVEVYIQTVENSNRKTNTLKNKSAVTAVTEDGKEIKQRYDTSNPTFNAIYEIKQAQIFNLSNNLARYIGKEMGAKDRHLLGVKQKSLYVTWQTTVPSVLVEVGYVTNPNERVFMNSKKGQETLATGIYNGIVQYKYDFDSSKEEALKEELSSIEQNNNEVIFMWQLFVSSHKLKANDTRFNKLKCDYYKQDGLFKYTYGSSKNYQEVLSLKKEVKKLFKDAFIVAIKNGKRVDIKSVKK